MEIDSIKNIHKECLDTLIFVRKYATYYHLKKKFDIFGDKFLITIFGGLLLSVFIIPFLGYQFILYIFIPFIGICFALIYRIIYYNIFRIIDINKKYSRLLDDIEKIHLESYNELEEIKNIDSILYKTKELYNHIRKLRLYRFIWKYTISPTGIHYMMKYIDLESSFITIILTDLRSDLAIRLTEQQSTLAQAKSEVSEHIHGTTELNQISNLQRVRLDRQIEQFEELQKVLMRV